LERGNDPQASLGVSVMADSAPDFLGPKLPLFPELTPEQQAEFDLLESAARDARKNMLSFVYESVRRQLLSGVSAEEIRADLLKDMGDDAKVLGVYFHESLVADLQNAIDDALSGRPRQPPPPGA